MHWRKWRDWRYRQKRQYRQAKKTQCRAASSRRRDAGLNPAAMNEEIPAQYAGEIDKRKIQIHIGRHGGE